MVQSMPSTSKDACDRMMAQAASRDLGEPFAAVVEAIEDMAPVPAIKADFYRRLENALSARGLDPTEEL